jgi:hypothetical protein
MSAFADVPHTKRSFHVVGVLTKPDRCERGNENRWTSILKGQESPLQNGWYSVKQPDSVQLKSGITWEEARESEKKFFDNTEPWSSIRGSARQRLGSPALTSHLSALLSELVLKR